MKRGKRGQGSATANFILMLVVFIIAYIILLPPAAKEEVYRPGSTFSPGEEVPVDGRLLTSATPGVVRPFLREVISRKIAPISLFAFTETEPRLLVRSLTVYTSFFSKKTEQLTFDAQELNNLEQVSLLFLVQEGQGRLALRVNGQEFYNDEVSFTDLPIEIPMQYLKKSENVLEIEASSPGARFLSTNTYYLKDIQLVKRLAVEHKRETRSFVLTPDENRDLVRSVLSYFVNCIRVKDLGTLDVYLNKRLVSSRFMVCDAKPSEVDLNPDYILPGENVLEFEVDRGEYILEQVILDNELETEDYPKYYFSLQVGEYLDVQDVLADVVLELEFDDYGYRKAATILVNGERVYLDTDDRRALIDISDFVVEGENFIKIIPREEFDIVNLQVVLR